MGKDLDTQWVHLLAVNRSNINGFTLPKASSHSNDRKRHVRSRSSVTNYFALLSASEHGSNAGRSPAYNQKASIVPSMTTRDMDSSWVAWFTERWQQRQLVDDIPGGGRTFSDHTSSELPFPKNRTLPHHSQPHPESQQQNQQQQQQQIQRHNNQDQDDSLLFNHHNTPPTTAISSARTTSPVPTNLDLDIENLDTFLSNFCTGSSFPPVPALTHNSSSASTSNNSNSIPHQPSTTNLVDDGAFTWLEDAQQPQHPFNPLPMTGGEIRGEEPIITSSRSPDRKSVV